MYQTRVTELPMCDLCRQKEAVIDGKTTLGGSWAYMCFQCFEKYGVGLGLGKGQELI